MRTPHLFRSLAVSALVLVASLGLVACDSDDPDLDARPSIAALLQTTAELSTLNAAVSAAGLTATLDGNTNYTVFAPTNSAFASLLDALDISAEQLLALDGIDGVLLYHVTAGTVFSTELSAGQTVTTARPEGAATFTIVQAGSGFGIDTSGDGQANARITTEDIEARNGVVHLIDAVLLPPDFMADDEPGTLDAVIAGRSDLSVLTTALGATGLTSVLANTESEFTVFAPTDDAFTTLLTSLDLTAEQLLALTGIDGVLLYHVTAGTVLSTDLSAGQTVTTARVNGEATFTVVAADGGFGIDTTGNGEADALITTVDIAAENGVVHVIDAVLVPSDFL